MVRSQYLVHVRIQYVSSLVFAEETFDNDMKEVNDESNTWKNLSMKMDISRIT